MSSDTVVKKYYTPGTKQWTMAKSKPFSVWCVFN